MFKRVLNLCKHYKPKLFRKNALNNVIYKSSRMFNSIISDGDSGRVPIDFHAMYKNRTSTTQGLWRLRNNLIAMDPIDPDYLPEMKKPEPRESWQSSLVICYNFKDNIELRNDYVRFDGGIRFGKILEDMDALAGNIMLLHCDNYDKYPKKFVTAGVDRIDMNRRFPMNRNLILEGNIIYTGKSSATIELVIFDKDDVTFEICKANFIMAARDGINNTSIAINPIKLETDMDQQKYLKAKFDGERRKANRMKELTLTKPTFEESEMIHKFYQDIHINKVINLDKDRELYQCIDRTRESNVIIAQPQSLNRGGKIFGGFLMRLAYELARLGIYQYIGGIQNIYSNDYDVDKHPVFISSDEISFNYPVSVGSIIRTESSIACTDSPSDYTTNDRHAANVIVNTYIKEPGSTHEIFSNKFSFVFGVPKVNLKRVVPLTYKEAMIYIDGKRGLDRTFEVAIRNGSKLAQYL